MIGSPVAGGREGIGTLVVYTVVTVVGTGVVSEKIMFTSYHFVAKIHRGQLIISCRLSYKLTTHDL